MKKTTEIGELQDGLYLLHHSVACSDKLPVLSQSICNSVVIDSHLWHARLGHPSVSSMKFLSPSMYQNSVSFNSCDTCHLAKQNRLAFTESNSCSSSLFELIQVDVWGPYRYKTHGNCSYFFTIVEDLSRATWVFLFADKSQVSTLLKTFVFMLTNSFHVQLKTSERIMVLNF